MKVFSLGLIDVQSLTGKGGMSLKQCFSNFHGHESPGDLLKVKALI